MGKFDDSVVPIGRASGTPSGAIPSADLQKALSTTTRAIAGSPQISLSGKYADSVQTAQDIALGKVMPNRSGIGGAIGSTIEKGLEGAGYLLGLPARTATSIGKETVDLIRGEGASFKELVTQPFDKDFYPSRFIPKTGNKWVDITVGLGADVLLDPLTYVAPTAVAGRAQRLALAARAGEAANIAKAPTLSTKIDDIVRYGEWALDDVEREVLNIPKGLRWQFGQDTPIFNPDTILGKASGYAAEAVGKPFSRVRATIGDIPALNRVQGFVRPKSYGGALNALGRRGELDGVDILREVSRYSASIRSRAQRGLMEQTLLAENQALLKELETSPFRNTVYEVIQGTAAREGRAVPLEEFNLAQRITDQLFNGSRSRANEFIQQFNARRGVDAFEIGDVEDYFHGTLSDDAQRYVSGRKFGRGGWDSEISQTIDLSPRDFVAGPSVMRGKKLVAGEEWLGETLQFGDIAEINRIARDKLGFDWFKTDALSVTADYIDAVARQTGRVAFVDRLFDYGSDVVDKILYKMVPDQELVSVAKQSYNSLNRAYNKIANSIDRLEASATATVGRVSGRAERASARGTEVGAVLRSDIAGLTADVTKARKALTQARSKATRKSNEIRKSFETVLAPLESRVQELEGILARGASEEELGAALLKDLHVRAFPNMDDAARPTRYADLARDIKSAAGEKYTARMEELLPLQEAGEDVTRKAAAAAGQETKTINKVEGARAQIRAARETTKGVKGELKNARAELARQKRVMEDAIKNDPAVKAVKDVKTAHVRAVNALKSKEVLLAKQVDWENAVKPELTKVIDEVREVVAPSDIARAKGSLTAHGGAYLLDASSHSVDKATLEAAKQAFRDLPDDEYVWVFHATDDPSGVLGKGRVLPYEGDRLYNTLDDALYVAATPEVGSLYGENIIALKVRKGDIANSTEWRKTGGSKRNDVTEALFFTSSGATLPTGTPYESVLIWSPEISARNWNYAQFWEFQQKGSELGTYRKLLSDAGIVNLKGEPPLIPTPLKASYKSISNRWVDNADILLQSIDNPALFNPAERDVWSRIFTSLKAAEADFGRIAGDAKYANAIVKALNDPTSPLYGNMVKDVREGWTAIEKLGIQVPQETADILFTGIRRFEKVDEVRQFLKIFNRYNQFFRVTAMLTPGFVVRNAYTAAFNNFVYGVTIKDTSDAIKFAMNLRSKGIGFALDSVPAAERALYEEAYRGVISSGAGQIMDISAMPLYEGANAKILNTRLVKVWGKANADAEVGARMAMGLRAARNGKNIDQISTDIARYHFDYSDLSKLDEIAKVFIPFWTFASRNIPLQIMNQIARPSMYRAYESAKRNMPVEEGMILPAWLAEREPLGFGAGGVLNPDLPQVDMSSQIQQLSDPLRLLSQFYPQYKLPIELAGNRQLGLNIPFSEKPQPVSGPLDLPAALAALVTGQTVDTAEGPAITSKIAYAVPNLLPTLALAQRLIPQAGGPEKYGERQLSSILASATGLPYRQVPPAEQERELKRREYQLRDYLDSLRDRGYIG